MVSQTEAPPGSSAAAARAVPAHRRGRGGRPGGSRRRRIGLQRRRAAYLMLAPAVVHLVWWIGIPVVATFVLAVSDYDLLTGTIRFAGLHNFVQIFRDPQWNAAIWHTIVYTIFTVPVAMGIALVVAVMLNQQIRARAWYRAAFFIPHVTATVAVAVVWAWLFEPRIGLFNAVLSVFGVNGPAWLSDPTWALPAVILVGIWKGIGLKMLIYLAALQGVPAELHEAAALDGAGTVRRFRSVTLPLLRPATFFVFVLSMIEAVQVFDQVYVLTSGGPADATTVVTYEIYLNAFQKLHFSIASAQSIVLFLFLLVLTLISRRLIGRDDDA